MEKRINIILFILLPFLASAQLFDTIFTDLGEVMLMEKPDMDRVEKSIKENGSALLRGNYKVIDSTGNLIRESFFQDLGEHGTIAIKMAGGKKNSELLILNNTTISKQYYESGNLDYEVNNYFDTDFGFKESRNYYDNPFNSIKNIHFQRAGKPEKFEGIIMEKWRVDKKYLMETLVVEQEITDTVYLPIREISFHANGKVKEQGGFSKRRFFEFRNREFYERWLEDGTGYINNFAVILDERVRIKNGKWQYFDEEGKLLKEEFYDDGKLIE